MSERIDALARRLESEDDFLASALAVYARAENLSDNVLAERLGCEVSRLGAIRLCRMPRREAPHFRQDIGRIAGAFQIDALALAEAVRLANSLAELEARDGAQGFLIAARDRTDEAVPEQDGDE